ncbi:hypothetical protein [Nocardia tenerifensis]|nr:hypothetical protein [Nocardia tenerifensis]
MSSRRSGLAAVLGALLVAVTTTGCLGAVDRADFEHDLRSRGGGLVSALPAAAFDTLRRRLDTAELHASVVLLTAPESGTMSFSVPAGSPQVGRFFDENRSLLTQDSAVHLRLRVPARPDQQDDYTFANGALHGPKPVHVSAFEDPDSEMFDVRDVSGLLRLEEVLDAALAQAAIENGSVTSVLVHRVGPDPMMTVDVTSPRTTVLVRFDRAGTYLGKSRT